MKRDVDRSAIQEVLGDLETSLEAYLVEWRRRLGIHEWPKAGLDREEQHPVATEQREGQQR
jgi:hypothetical protein